MIGHPDGGETQSVPDAVEIAAVVPQYAVIALERIIEGKQRIQQYAAREPVKALGIAFGLGIMVGWLSKRR